MPYRQGVTVATPLQLPRGRARGAARGVAAAVALLALVAGAVGVHAHVAAQPHGVCEHGAEVHLERVGDPTPTPAHAGASVSDPTWWPEHGDHHCRVTAPLGTDDRRPHVLVAGRAAPHRLLASPAVTPAAAHDRYRLAPKTSPPVGPA